MHKKINAEDFSKIWTGIIILLVPGRSFISNRKVPTLKRIFTLASPYRRSLLFAIGCAIIYSVLSLILSVYIQKIIDEVVAGKNMHLLFKFSVAMVLVLIIQLTTGTLRNYIMLNSGMKIDISLIPGYYRHLLHLPQSFTESIRVGEMVSRINDAFKISAFINEVAITMVVDALIIIFSLIIMFFYYWKLALVMLVIVPVYVALYYLNHRINRRWQRKIVEAAAEVDTEVVQSMTAIRTIKKLAIENFCFNRMNIKFEYLLRSSYRFSFHQICIQGGGDFFTKLFTVIILWTGSYYVIRGQLTTGELLSFFALISYFTAPVMNLLSANRNIRDAIIAGDRLFEITDLEGEKDDGIKWNKDQRLEGNIVFRNVYFRYGNGKNVLDDLNLVIRNGTITGIKGDSGSGKSTIVSLLLNLYVPSSGKIFINGIDTTDMNKSSLRKLIACVPQHTELLAGSLKQNIVLDDEGTDMEWLLEISERLGITDFVNDLPAGFETILYEQGSNLSGGQRQRISIARALYRRSRILVLDEATSSIDLETENKIMQTIEWYNRKGNTVIIIAHTESALKICDKIVVLENGRIEY